MRLMELVARAGGNPLYARELADGLVRDGLVRVDGGIAEVPPGQAARVPPALAAAIAGWLGALSGDELPMLEWAAVLGARFSMPNLEAVSGQATGTVPALVDAAVTAGLLARSHGLVEFRHELIRQVLYDDMPRSRRSAMHASAALALARVGAPAEKVAPQLVAGQGEPDGAAIISRGWLADWLAGTVTSLMHRAPEAAARLLKAALTGLGEDDDRREPLKAALVHVSFLLARHQDVEQFGTALIARSADPQLVAEMAWLAGYARLRIGRLHDASTLIAGTLDRPGFSGEQRSRLMAIGAVISFALGNHEEATRSATAVLARDAVRTWPCRQLPFNLTVKPRSDDLAHHPADAARDLH